MEMSHKGPVRDPICTFGFKRFLNTWDLQETGTMSDITADDDFVEDDDDDYCGRYLAESEEQYIVIDDDADVDESEMPDDGFHDDDEGQRDIMRQV